MISCFQPSCGGSDSVAAVTGHSKIVYDADPKENRDTTEDGYLHRLTKIYGRDGDLDAIKRLLFDPGDGGDDNPSVVRVVGIGGLGKTTLARYVYNDPAVKAHFEARAWFRVPESLDVADLVLAIVRSTGGDPDAYEDIRVAVGGKRLLLVLDDVWDETAEELEGFRVLLGDTAEGSKIMVTTRSEQVAARLGGAGSTVYPLQGLSDEDCWKLFKQKAFSAVREESQQLETIGRDIVDKFQGVPLTAVAIGSLLRFIDDRSVWAEVRDSEIWELPDVAKKTLSALKLSYDHLPSHLRSCFEYCSLFPKAYRIDRERLVELWIVEGFVSASGTSVIPEDVGDDYFNDLLLRSFFQEEEEEYSYESTYRMHDLFHDLAQSIVGGEHSTMEADRVMNLPRECRRIALLCAWKTLTISEALYRSKKLETLFLLMRDTWLDSTYKCSMNVIPHQIFSRLRSLRLLDLSCIKITELPKSISKLKHLRYLNLSGTDIETLPESISRLKNLCVLKLESCMKFHKLPHSIKNLHSLKVLNLDGCILLQELPEGICNLYSLTHLRMDKCILLTHLPQGIGRLTGLQMLSQFPLGEELGSSIAELQDLNLRGHIYIRNLGNLRNPMDSSRANMKEKHQLQQLELHWNLDYSGDKVNWVAGYSGDIGRDVLEGFQPHANLEELTIGGYWGTNFPSWMAPKTIQSSLVNLVKVTLVVFGMCTALPPLGELPSLKTLQIMSFHALKHLSSEFYGSGTFPSLVEFEISNMPALEEWTVAVDGGNLFPCLTQLKIERCPQLRTLPHLYALEVLRVSKASEWLLSSRGQDGWKMPSLKDLCITSCSAPSGWDALQSLPALETLCIRHCRESSIPDGLQHLTSVRSLTIQHCPNLAMLPVWLGNFSLLQALKIHFHPKLAHLPESVRRLQSLQNLEVRGDSNLWSQHMIGEEDWKDQHNITHVPNIRFEMWVDLTVSDPELEWGGALIGK